MSIPPKPLVQCNPANAATAAKYQVKETSSRRSCRVPLALLQLLLWKPLALPLNWLGLGIGTTYQGLHGSMQRVSVVSSELGVGAFQRWVS
jgi:hypothetical protein